LSLDHTVKFCSFASLDYYFMSARKIPVFESLIRKR